MEDWEKLRDGFINRLRIQFMLSVNKVVVFDKNIICTNDYFDERQFTPVFFKLTKGTPPYLLSEFLKYDCSLIMRNKLGFDICKGGDYDTSNYRSFNFYLNETEYVSILFTKSFNCRDKEKCKYIANIYDAPTYLEGCIKDLISKGEI